VVSKNSLSVYQFGKIREVSRLEDISIRLIGRIMIERGPLGGIKLYEKGNPWWRIPSSLCIDFILQ